MKDSMARFDSLASDVARKFEAIRRRNHGRMECRKGCADCCRCRLSITRVEEAYLRQGLARLPLSVRLELKTQATTEPTDSDTNEMCPALDANGCCKIFESRPLICRSHGVPLRYRYPVPLIHPAVIDVCEKNFANLDGVSMKSLPIEDVLDQTSLTAELAEIDADHCDEHELPRGERVPLARILAAFV